MIHRPVRLCRFRTGEFFRSRRRSRHSLRWRSGRFWAGTHIGCFDSLDQVSSSHTGGLYRIRLGVGRKPLVWLGKWWGYRFLHHTGWGLWLHSFGLLGTRRSSVSDHSRRGSGHSSCPLFGRLWAGKRVALGCHRQEEDHPLLSPLRHRRLGCRCRCQGSHWLLCSLGGSFLRSTVAPRGSHLRWYTSWLKSCS